MIIIYPVRLFNIYSLWLTMNPKTVLGIAAVLAIVLAPAVMISTFADPAPKQDESCSDEKFSDRDSCPGKSEEAKGNDRDDECVARNKGQSDEDCTETVNPPND
jgi:hypothetical protein